MVSNSSLNASSAVTADASSDLILMVTLFQGLPGVRYACFAALLLIYSATMLANLTLALVICLESSLRRPMFLLMALLSATDAVETTNLLPRIMANLVSRDSHVTVPECIAQMFFVHTGIRLQSFILTSNVRVLRALLASVALATLPIFGYVAVASGLRYCRPMVTSSPNCDITIIGSLSCGDLYPSVIFTYVNIVTGIALPLLLVVAMYGLVFADLRRRRAGPSERSHRKAVHTCLSHLFVVAVFFAFIAFTFINGLNLYTIPRDVRFPLQILQYVVPPALNPVVYGLRTAEIRRAFVRLVTRRV
uniref:G-protein coupled receptors family 1 profile domain-containing protein n=1 Tax=Petromyzon marinus TaxID=7757 RepID=S4RX68_PETMA